jgi:hypothetical protein
MTNFLSETIGERGSMALVTERTRDFGLEACELCATPSHGGTAHAVIVQEDNDAETRWLLWVLADGFSVSDESAKGPIAVCAECQVVPVVRMLRFAQETAVASPPARLSR